MATHMRIFNVEDSAKAVMEMLIEARREYEAECLAEETPNYGYNVNHHVWGSLFLTLHQLKLEVEKTLVVLSPEFAQDHCYGIHQLTHEAK